MINAEDEVTIDLRRSCTREEAAIKILGWMRGPIQKVASETDDPLNSLLNNGKFNSPLTDLLQKEREAADGVEKRYAKPEASRNECQRTG